ncbi:hypothetical protein ACH4UR_37255 [Streptomyces lydicus]|uniref:hypothetical protein n=1 Tax=Streptomyces lydicus TaxID=47763 RepID=UPI0033FC8793
MTTQQPDCTWANRPVSATTTNPDIGTATTIDPRTGLTTRYRIHTYNPRTHTLLITPDANEGRAGVVCPFPAEQRAQPRTFPLTQLHEVRLTHRRSRDDSATCHHVIKAAFTAGGDYGVPRHRRVYKFGMQTTGGATYRFLVHAPTQAHADRLARRWWQGAPTSDGFKDSRLPDGERIRLLSCEGARDMHWPYHYPIADPV